MWRGPVAGVRPVRPALVRDGSGPCPRVVTRTDNGRRTEYVRSPLGLNRPGSGHVPTVPRSVATNTRVELAELLDFVRPRHHHILVTTRSSGSPQLSPVSAGIDPQGRVVIATYPERAKVHNLRRSPGCSVMVLSDDWDGPWVQVNGTAEVLDLPDALEPFVDYYRSISGEHPDWDEYKQAMIDQGKCLVRITPTRWGPIATGGFPARLAND